MIDMISGSGTIAVSSRPAPSIIFEITHIDRKLSEYVACTLLGKAKRDNLDEELDQQPKNRHAVLIDSDKAQYEGS